MTQEACNITADRFNCFKKEASVGQVLPSAEDKCWTALRSLGLVGWQAFNLHAPSICSIDCGSSSLVAFLQVRLSCLAGKEQNLLVI